MVKIFVGNVSPNAKTDDLRRMFERYGSVDQCDRIKHYAFVHMSNENEAYKAIARLNDTWLSGERIKVRLSHALDGMVKIYVGNLRPYTNVDKLRELFENYGKVFEADIVDEKYGFIHMENPEEAKEAIKNLYNYDLDGAKLDVKLSHANKTSIKNDVKGDSMDGEKEEGKTVKLFVGNLPRDARSSELKQMFEEVGEVFECSIIDKYAFVHMISKPAAMRAISELDGRNYLGSTIDVKLSHGGKKKQLDSVSRRGNFRDDRIVSRHRSPPRQRSRSRSHDRFISSRRDDTRPMIPMVPIPMDTVKIFVGNIAREARTIDLRKLFEEYGPVVKTDILDNYGFVHMYSENDAKIAIRELNRIKFFGKTLCVEPSKSTRGPEPPTSSMIARSSGLGGLNPGGSILGYGGLESGLPHPSNINAWMAIASNAGLSAAAATAANYGFGLSDPDRGHPYGSSRRH